MNFESIETLAQMFASNELFGLNEQSIGVECLVRESKRSYTGAVCECRFVEHEKAVRFSKFVLHEIDYHTIKIRRIGELFVVSVPVQ